MNPDTDLLPADRQLWIRADTNSPNLAFYNYSCVARAMGADLWHSRLQQRHLLERLDVACGRHRAAGNEQLFRHV